MKVGVLLYVVQGWADHFTQAGASMEVTEFDIWMMRDWCVF